MLLLAVAAPAAYCLDQTTPRAMTDDRVAHLRRGVNVSHWFYNVCGGLWNTDDHLTSPEMQELRQAGIDHVRLAVDPSLLLSRSASSGPVTDAFVRALERAIQAFNAADLAVIVSLRPKQPASFLDKTVSVEAFAKAWQVLAGRLSTTNAQLVFFEPISNPGYESDRTWGVALNKLIDAINAVAPKHTVVAVPANTRSLERLLALRPGRTGNVAYAFHFKLPRVFVDQGAPFAPKSIAALRLVPYPLNARSAHALLESLPAGASRLELARAARENWDAAHIQETVARLAAWGTRYGVPVLCVEFWVYKPNSAPEARAAWLRDVRTALEKHGIGWCVWEHLTASRGLKLAYLDRGDYEPLGLANPAGQRR